MRSLIALLLVACSSDPAAAPADPEDPKQPNDLIPVVEDTDVVDTDVVDTPVAETPVDSDAPADTDTVGETAPPALSLAAIGGSYVGTPSPTDACASGLDYSLVSVSPIDDVTFVLATPTRQAMCEVGGADASAVTFGCVPMGWAVDRQLGGGNFCLAEYQVLAGGSGDGSTLQVMFNVNEGGGCTPCFGTVSFTGARAPF